MPSTFLDENTVEKLKIIENKYEHIQVIRVPKRKGGHRIVHVPDDKLKHILREILAELQTIEGLAPSPFAFAFIRNRSVMDHAGMHCNKEVVVRIDLKDFFLQCNWDAHIRDEIHRAARHDPKIEEQTWELIRIACCIHREDEPSENFWGEQYLPQGFPTSPFLSNLAFRSYDWKLARIASRFELVYSRYADDLVFSGGKAQGIIPAVKAFLQRNGWKINDEKLMVMRQPGRQLVGGLLVNGERPRLPGKMRKIIRAIRHRLSLGKPIDDVSRGLLAWALAVERWEPRYLNSIAYLRNRKAVLDVIG